MGKAITAKSSSNFPGSPLSSSPPPYRRIDILSQLDFRDRTLLLSCKHSQALPRYDRYYVEVLQRSADLVFIANRSRYVTDQFRLRMQRALAQEGLAMDRLHRRTFPP